MDAFAGGTADHNYRGPETAPAPPPLRARLRAPAQRSHIVAHHRIPRPDDQNFCELRTALGLAYRRPAKLQFRVARPRTRPRPRSCCIWRVGRSGSSTRPCGLPLPGSHHPKLATQALATSRSPGRPSSPSVPRLPPCLVSPAARQHSAAKQRLSVDARSPCCPSSCWCARGGARFLTLSASFRRRRPSGGSDKSRLAECLRAVGHSPLRISLANRGPVRTTWRRLLQAFFPTPARGTPRSERGRLAAQRMIRRPSQGRSEERLDRRAGPAPARRVAAREIFAGAWHSLSRIGAMLRRARPTARPTRTGDRAAPIGCNAAGPRRRHDASMPKFNPTWSFLILAGKSVSSCAGCKAPAPSHPPVKTGRLS